jgi:hypothetical protein
MTKTMPVLLAAGFLLTGAVQASEGLSCRIHQDLMAGEGQAPETTEFIWSTAHESAEQSRAIATSIGEIAPGEDVKSITLNGQPVQLPTEVDGLIRFGKVYDYGDRVVLAYRVEREWDSSATPSEVVYALNKQRAVTDIDLLPGDAVEDGTHCVLIP